MTILHFTSYPALVDYVRRVGVEAPSRYGDTLEACSAVSFEFPSDQRVSRPGFNRALAYMELYQVLSGIFDLDALARVAPNAHLELFTQPMSYGPRICPQIPDLLEALSEPEHRRQCLVFVGTPADGMTTDQPCTTSIQFLQTNGVLDTVISMRSWDLLKGLPYDVVVFGGLTQAIARITGLKPGKVSVRAGSGHLYINDLELLPPSYQDDPVKFQVAEMGWTFAPKNWVPRWHILSAWAYEVVQDPVWVKGLPEGTTEGGV